MTNTSQTERATADAAADHVALTAGQRQVRPLVRDTGMDPTSPAPFCPRGALIWPLPNHKRASALIDRNEVRD